jgi:UPF0755 protein
MMPPRPGPPPRPVSRRRVLVRRLVAFVVLAGLVGGGVALAIAARGTSGPSATTATLAAPKPFRVIFPEGFTRKQMAQRVTDVAQIAERKGGKKVRLSGGPYLRVTGRRPMPGFGTKPLQMEGFLFPATYDFVAATTSRQLVADQLDAFRQNWSKLDLRYARTKHLTPYDVLIIASMVEKETLAPDERPKVAAVIYNRLKAGMALGIDATIRYGLDIPPTESIRVSQLQSDNPYNTRKFVGLPPTPIANPGLASMQAAAHPAKVDFVYFVRKPDRVHHYFTASYRDFVNYENAHGYNP